MRIANTHDPRTNSNDGRVGNTLIVRACKSKPITIYGDGSPTRSFCYVDVLIDDMV